MQHGWEVLSAAVHVRTQCGHSIPTLLYGVLQLVTTGWPHETRVSLISTPALRMYIGQLYRRIFIALHNSMLAYDGLSRLYVAASLVDMIIHC
jgi:hypothetical protein